MKKERLISRILLGRLSRIFNFKPLLIFLLIISFFLHIGIQLGNLKPEDLCVNYKAAREFVDGGFIYSELDCGIAKYSSHPPTGNFLYLPFVTFPLLFVTIFWSLIMLLCYIVGGVFLLAGLGWLNLRGLVFFSFGSLFWYYFLIAGLVHNSAFLFFLFLIASFFVKRRGYDYLAGGLIGLLALIKIWPLILIFGALCAREKKMAVSGLIIFGIGILISFPIFGIESYYFYFLKVSKYYEEIFLHSPFNISLIGVVMKLFVGYGDKVGAFLVKLAFDDVLKLGYTMSAGLMLATGGFIFWQSGRIIKERRDFLIFGLMLTGAILTFPLMWDWNLIYLMLPILIMLKERVGLWNKSRKLRIAFWVVLLFIFNPLAYLVFYKIYILKDNFFESASIVNLLITLSVFTLLIIEGFWVKSVVKIGPRRELRNSCLFGYKMVL